MTKKTLVVVLGWWNAIDTHVKKYSALYNKLGYPTHVFTAPPGVMFNPYAPERVAALELSKIAQHCKDLDCNKLIFHSFSNNGCLMFHGFQKAIKNNSSLLNNVHVQAGVFDSSPGMIDLFTFYKAVFGTSLSPAIKYATILVPFLLYFLPLNFVLPRS